MPLTPSYAGSFQLRTGEVHTWCISLDVSPEACARLHATLACDERSRSAHFRFERDRRRFIVAHGVLRALLGRYLGTPPGEVRFVRNAFGKPALSPDSGSGLRFNLAHSADLVLIAIAADAEVGIDVEYVRAVRDAAEIATHFLSSAEGDHLTKLPPNLRGQAFFSCWTKKEAYVKARGEGLTIPLSTFSAPPTTDPDPVEFHDASHDVVSGRRWSLYTLQPAPGYIGALAIEGSGWRLCQLRWAVDG